ncbi:MAG: hypothetical protein M1381_02640 [Deltaproteobacteria bacterium]|nr:hypothetical protein [Deltaproteobacteria bacterium]MCL5791895.1 hypothetical protein [Deltaproteobacteria bacterium]
MNISEMLKSLQDPVGIPFYPLAFQILLVLTFALHIVFVNFVIGGSFMAVYSYFRTGKHYRALSKAFAKATTINLSLAIVLGVAPLLFIQVIYDPFWYTSNVLSGSWMIGILFVLMSAFSFAYTFYLKLDKGKSHIAVWGILAFLLVILAAVIMHAVSYQALLPEKWFEWYTNNNGVNLYGTRLHAFQLPRFLHFIAASFALTGVFMMLYSWYFWKREDMDSTYLAWVGKTGAEMAVFFTVLQMAAGVWWLLSLPATFHLYTNYMFLTGVSFAIIMLLALIKAQTDPRKYALPVASIMVITVLAMSSLREVLRMLYAGKYNYSIYSYKLNLSYDSTALFLASFVMGLIIVGYMLTVVFKMGRSSKPVELSSLKLRTWSVYLMIAWILIMIGIGAAITS